MNFLKIEDSSGYARGTEAAPPLTRRTFLKLTVITGGGLTLGVMLPACSGSTGSSGAAAAQLVMPFVRVDSNNTVTLICKHLESGQGVWTGLAAVLAEELDAAWDQMRVDDAPAKVPAYANLTSPNATVQFTGASTSMANSWEQLRQAGATARAMLVAAAAERWGVPTHEISVTSGLVSHASHRQAKFGELAEAAAKQPLPKEVKLKDPGQFKLIGSDRLPRIDSRAKSSGKQQFAIDVRLPGMMTAMVMRPPRFGAKVKSIDAAATKAVPGVVDVVQIPRGVAVVARDTWAAKKGREALQVAWNERDAETRGTDQLMAEYKRLARQCDAFGVITLGDTESGFKSAAKVIEAEFEFPYLAHAPMEPLNAVCQLSPSRCEIWAGTQFQTFDQANAAAAVGLSPEQVILHTVAAGGAFGRRATLDSDFVSEVACIAKATGGKYPVHLLWTREDDITGGRYRPLNYHRIKAGLGKDGSIAAYEQRMVGQSVLAGTPYQAEEKPGFEAVEGSAPEQYDIDNVEVTWSEAKVGVPILWWRSVAHSYTAFSKEVVIDELAEAARQDPVAFRLALLRKNPRQAAVLKLAAEKAGWGAPFEAGKGRGRGVALHECFGTVVAQVAEVTVNDGRVQVDRVVCAVDCGVAVTPDVVRAQMEGGIGFGLGAALYGRITLSEGRVDQTNFHQYEVLRINKMPRIVEVHIVPSAAAPSGVGEPGVPPIAPAVANAVRAATGIKIHKLPIDLAAARAVAIPGAGFLGA